MSTVDRATRFRVLSESNFTCRYCGRSAPEVALEVDHVQPRARGGSNRRGNLVAACFDCNRGKRDKIIALPDRAVPTRPVPTLACDLCGDKADYVHVLPWACEGFAIEAVLSCPRHDAGGYGIALASLLRTDEGSMRRHLERKDRSGMTLAMVQDRVDEMHQRRGVAYVRWRDTTTDAVVVEWPGRTQVDR